MAAQIICSESALIMRVVSLWWIQSHVYGIGTGAVPRWIFNCKREAGFRFQDHLQYPSVADRPKKGRAQLKRAVFCLFVKQTLYTEYGHSLPWLQISDSMFNTFLVIPWKTYVRLNWLIQTHTKRFVDLLVHKVGHLILGKAFYKLLERWLIVLTWYRIRLWRCWWSMVSTTLWW